MRFLAWILLIGTSFAQVSVSGSASISGGVTLTGFVPSSPATVVGVKCATAGSGTSINCAFTGVTAGSTLVVSVMSDGAGSVSGVSDSQGSYSAVMAQTTDNTCNIRTYYLANANAGSHTVTASISNSNAELYIRGVEVKNADTSSPLGTTAVGSNTGSTASIASAATLSGNAGDMILAFGGNESAGETYTKGTGFDALDQTTQLFAEYQALSGSVSSYAATATQSSATKFVIQAMTIKKAP